MNSISGLMLRRLSFLVLVAAAVAFILYASGNVAYANSVQAGCDGLSGLSPSFSSVAGTSLTVHWTDNCTDEQDWFVLRNGAPVSGGLGAGRTSYTDTGLTCGARYTYSVEAIKYTGGGNQIAFSSSASVSTANCGDTDPTPTSTATATNTPTDTPAPPTSTSTPTPTDTPLPTSTSTPSPTDTPLPTDTPSPTPTGSPAQTATPTATAGLTPTSTDTASGAITPTATSQVSAAAVTSTAGPGPSGTPPPGTPEDGTQGPENGPPEPGGNSPGGFSPSGGAGPIVSGQAVVSPPPAGTAGGPAVTATAIPSATRTPVSATPSPTPRPVSQVEAARIVPASNFLTSAIPGLGEISTNLGVVATNLSLALVALILILIATTIFNSTIEDNEAEIGLIARRLERVGGGLGAVFGWATDRGQTSESIIVSIAKAGAILSLTGLIYALLDPGFGLNQATLVLVVALIAGLLLTTFMYEGGQVLWSARRYDSASAMRLYPLAIIIALASVGLTRVTHLHPGVIFGFVTAAAIAPRHALSKREKGMIVLVPVISLLTVSVVAFLLIDPLRTYSQQHTGVWASLPETIAIALFVGGAESVLLTLIPVTFNDGEQLWSWSKRIWFALALPASFMFFHVVVNNEDYGELAQDTSKLAILIICGVIVSISAATWLYFRLKRRGEPD